MLNTNLYYKVEDANEKSLICNQILNELPSWFSVPQSIIDYTQQVRSLPMFACKNSETVLGFITLEPTNTTSAEVLVMGVLQSHHKQGIGRTLLEKCENYCKGEGITCLFVKTLAKTRTSTSYEKTRAFYLAMDFLPQMTLKHYWDEDNPCLCMVKPLDSLTLNAIQMQTEHIRFAHQVKFSKHNKAVLYSNELPLEEWESLILNSLADANEANFIVRKGTIPVVYMKLNELQTKQAWINMLVVDERFHRQGVASFAVRFAEEFACMNGITAIGIHTTADNYIAQNCYKKMGYVITEECDCTTKDGKKRKGYTFYRDHLNGI